MKILHVLLAVLVVNFSAPAFGGEPSPPAAPKKPVAKEVTPDEAARIMKDEAGVFVLDVRTPDEFAAGHIPNAYNIDFLSDDFEKRVASLASFPVVIFHCAAGSRSSQAMPKILALKKSGTVYYHLKSGFNGWKAAGKPVETKPAAK